MDVLVVEVVRHRQYVHRLAPAPRLPAFLRSSLVLLTLSFGRTSDARAPTAEVEGSKEELLFNCGKLFAASKVFALYADDRIGVCGKALLIQNDLEADADLAFLKGDTEKGKQLDGKALVMRSFRRLLRGDLK